VSRRVALLFGGRSVEHEVSVQSARSVAASMAEAGIECVPIGVAGDGRWLGTEASARSLAGAADRVEPDANRDDGSRVLIDPGGERLIELVGGDARSLPVDAVFPIVHGQGGEDGGFQGALETAGIPYVGTGVRGSAMAMDKIVTKEVARDDGIPVVPWVGFLADDWAADPAVWTTRIAEEIGFPAFVKPANGGSSVGVTRVDAPSGLTAALDEAFACDGKVLVEKGVDGREIECAVLGNLDPEASVLGEIAPSGEFYDYAAKYVDDASELHIPAALGEDQATAIRRTAVRIYRRLELAGFARVDFLLDRGDSIAYLNEINTLPGFTSISMFPKLWEATGLPGPRLVERLIDLALERHARERGLRTRRTEIREG
jgi:D-alanine-D-alanine ligase